MATGNFLMSPTESASLAFPVLPPNVEYSTEPGRAVPAQPPPTTTPEGIIAQQYNWDLQQKKWSPPSTLDVPTVPEGQRITCLSSAGTVAAATSQLPAPSLVVNLPRGGRLNVWRQWLDSSLIGRVRQEMLTTVRFRRYRVQGTWEPRVHCLYHAQATADQADNDSTLQPGYRYGAITLKARSLQELDVISGLTSELGRYCQATKLAKDSEDQGGKSVEEQDSARNDAESFWNVGVNPVIYRSGRDRMGQHADNDQGENLIMTAVIDGPVEDPRRLVIEPFACKKNRLAKTTLTASDRKYELMLRPGDVYSMDGEMQRHYIHSVPPKLSHYGIDEEMGAEEEQRRMVIVFRRGDFCKFARDSGHLVSDPCQIPEKMSYKFGTIEGLDYGGVYLRSRLVELGAHLGIQRSISGSSQFGCDAVIISAAREDDYEWDAYFDLVYAVESRKGGGALEKSYQCGYRVRIFRSSHADGSIKGRGCQNGYVRHYRYDGLYDVAGMQKPREAKTTPYLFYLRMANPNMTGENPDRHNDSNMAIPQTPEAGILCPTHFTRPHYLDGMRVPRITRSRFLRLLDLETSQGRPHRRRAPSASHASEEIFYFFATAMSNQISLLGKLQKEEEREREEYTARQREVLALKREMRERGPRQIRKNATVRVRIGDATHSCTRKRLRGFPRLKCNCRQFRCCECGQCSKRSCPRNPCRCSEGPLRLDPVKPRGPGAQSKTRVPGNDEPETRATL